jgi:DNA-binding transcriptional LysR family regulator
VCEDGDHACLRPLRSNGAIAHWISTEAGRSIELIVGGPFITLDYSMLVGAAARGLGLAQVPASLAASTISAGKVRAVLNDYAATTPAVFLYHLGKRQVLPKLRAFIDHVKLAS